MSRIHQILSRADREGTTAGLTWPDQTGPEPDIVAPATRWRVDPAISRATDDGDDRLDDPIAPANGTANSA